MTWTDWSTVIQLRCSHFKVVVKEETEDFLLTVSWFNWVSPGEGQIARQSSATGLHLLVDRSVWNCYIQTVYSFSQGLLFWWWREPLKGKRVKVMTRQAPWPHQGQFCVQSRARQIVDFWSWWQSWWTKISDINILANIHAFLYWSLKCCHWTLVTKCMKAGHYKV